MRSAKKKEVVFRIYNRFHQGRRGFTLIELLIVIAIILILIAIALPNFLEAQIRARVTKAKGEMRSLITAMESYYLDWNVYPSESEHNAITPGARPRTEAGLTWLTSPIPYITDVPEDPFPGQTEEGFITYELGGVETAKTPQVLTKALETWALYSRGPDSPAEDVNSEETNYGTEDGEVNQYNPTNGTKSNGDIFHYGGDPFYIGVRVDGAVRSIARTAPTPGLPVDGQLYIHRLPPGLF